MRIVATAAFLLLLLRFNNADAAGPYDGEWTGTATSTGERCKRAVVKLTVEGQIVLGQTKFERDAPNINGTVDEHGTVGATIGFQPLTGQFTGEEFEGTFRSFDCEWKALLSGARGNAFARSAPRTIARWESALRAHIERFKRYPPEARARGDQGTARIAFTIDHEGHLVSSRIVQSSGSAMLDQETLDMLVRAQPMPKPPDNILASELSFIVPINFNFNFK
jgi:TonB family protein